MTLKDIHEQFGDRVALIIDGPDKTWWFTQNWKSTSRTWEKCCDHALDVRVVLWSRWPTGCTTCVPSRACGHKTKRSLKLPSFYAPVAHRLGLHKKNRARRHLCFKLSTGWIQRYCPGGRKSAEDQRRVHRNRFGRRLTYEIFKDWISIPGCGTNIIYHLAKDQRKRFFPRTFTISLRCVIMDVPKELRNAVPGMYIHHHLDHFQPDYRKAALDHPPKSNGYESLQTTAFLAWTIKICRNTDCSERMRRNCCRTRFCGTLENTRLEERGPGCLRKMAKNRVQGKPRKLSGNAIELLDIRSELFTEEVHGSPLGEMKSAGWRYIGFAFSIRSILAVHAGRLRSITAFAWSMLSCTMVIRWNHHRQNQNQGWLQHGYLRAKNRIRSTLKEEKRSRLDYGRKFWKKLRAPEGFVWWKLRYAGKVVWIPCGWVSQRHTSGTS